jgi:hypothetical protein
MIDTGSSALRSVVYVVYLAPNTASATHWRCDGYCGHGVVLEGAEWKTVASNRGLCKMPGLPSRVDLQP